MSQLPATAETIKKLGITGIGIDKVEQKLYLFQQFEPKIVGHLVPNPTSNSGKYYVEGDITEYINSYDYFWVNGREMSDDNIFQVDSATFDSDNLWTEIVVTYSSEYSVKYTDEGDNICGRIDATELLSKIGTIEHTLAEEGSVANSVASTIDFTIIDEDKIYYNRNQKSGLFFKKDVLTEVFSVQSQCEFSPKSGVYATYVKVRSIPKYWDGEDFVNGHMEMITGEASGSRSVINYANGYNLKMLGYYAKNYKDVTGFHYDVKPGDKIRLFKSENFWFRLDMWLRGESDETVAVIGGKLDLDTVRSDDTNRLVSIRGYSTIRDLQNKTLSNLDMDGGLNLSRLHELKTLFIDNATIQANKTIVRSELSDQPLSSVKVEQVGFDVAEGWHVLDFHPYGNLFRFDLGRWHQVIDEGSFEKSTGQIFLLSYDDTDYYHPAKLPAHDGMFLGNVDGFQNSPPGSPSPGDRYAIGDSPTGAWAGHKGELATYAVSEWYYTFPTFGHRLRDTGGSQDLMFDGDGWTTNIDAVNNVLAERNWHGKWVTISIATEEVFTVGSTGGQYRGGENYQFKKLSGLPKFPIRILFKINEDRSVADYSIFQYSYDNGGPVIPHYLFDYIEEWDSVNDEHLRDITYVAGLGCKVDRKDDYTYPMYFDNSESVKSMRCWNFRRFNGVLINFDNSADQGLNVAPDTYENFGTSYLASMQLRFSLGDGVFSPNVNLRYTSGRVWSVTSQTEFLLAINRLSESWDENYTNMVGMKILWVQGVDGVFLEERTITSVTQDGTDLESVIIEIDKAFTGTVALNSTCLMILNKNFNLKVIDPGDSFKFDEEPDMAAVEDIGIEDFVDHRVSASGSVAGIDEDILPLDRIWVGHRRKFDTVTLAFDKTDSYDNYANLAWYLKEEKFLVEYWNGYEWRNASGVTVVPTTLLPIKDSGSVDDFDDYVKLRISFQANDWHTGGYDHTDWVDGATNEAPSNIDEDLIYAVRITPFSNIMSKIKRIGLGKRSELSMALMWDSQENWRANMVTMDTNKVVVDTLNKEDLELPMYGVELYSSTISYQSNQAYSHQMVRLVRPITKFQGSLKDALYGVCDFNETDSKFNQDIIVANPNKHNNISYFPKNINFHYLMDLILDGGGFANNRRNLTFLDQYNTVNQPRASIIGSSYDGVYPIDVGWDAAIVNKRASDYMELDTVDRDYVDTCCLRINGKYYIWVIQDTKDQCRLYESEDLINWDQVDSDVFVNVGTIKVISISVCKNKQDDTFGYYVTYRPNDSSLYRVGVVTSTSMSNAIDLSSLTDIYSSVTDQYSSIDVIQVEGKTTDSTSCARLMVATRHSGSSNTNDYPSGSPTMSIAINSEDSIDGTWSEAESKANFEYGTIVMADYSCTGVGVTPFDSTRRRTQNFFVIARNSSDQKLYGFRQETTISSWNDGAILKDEVFPYTGFKSIKDGIIYNLRDQSGETAYSLIPYTQDVNLFSAIDSGKSVKVVALNPSFNDWDDDGWFENQIIEQNEMDWFRSYNNELDFDYPSGDETNRTRLYLGFRKPFGKVDCFPSRDTDFYKPLRLRYWNGVEWVSMPYIYQNNEIRTDGKFHPEMGFNFELPDDWVSDSIEEIAEGDTNLKQHINALYWICIDLGDYADYSWHVNMRRFALCYTSLFLTKGRSLFLMENWSYVRNIYTYPFEIDKNMKIDSIAADPQSKTVVVNYVEDNPYEVTIAESMSFDYFGKFLNSVPLWLNDSIVGVNQYITLKDRPDSVYRKGVSASFLVDDLAFYNNINLIGCWTQDFLEDINDGTMSGSNDCSGWNIPVPSRQLIRKWTIRNEDWFTWGSTYFKDTHCNNILLGKRNGLLHQPQDILNFNETLRNLFYSLSNNGLLHEELINGPYTLVDPGHYAAVERNFLKRAMQYDLRVEGYVTYASLPAANNTNSDKNYIISDTTEANSIAWCDGSSWNIRKPTIGMIVYKADTADYWIYASDSIWKDLSSDVVWPGRNTAVSEGIGLEWTLGQEGIKIPYFRPLYCKPDRWMNNNVFAEFDYKASTVFRHLNLTVDYYAVFGHDFYSPLSSVFDRNVKPTCGVLMKDLTSVKDSVGPSDDQRIMQANFPGIAFGSYHFKDTSHQGTAPTRWSSPDAYPLGNCGIGMYKPYGMTRHWKKCFYYDHNTGYEDITDKMNYRDTSHGGYRIDYNVLDYVFVGSDHRFFAIALNKNDDNAPDIRLEYWNGTSWNIIDDEVINKITDEMVEFINQDDWAKKTCGYTYFFNPFIEDWVKNTVNGTEAYWIRITYYSYAYDYNDIYWVSQCGTWLFDNMTWWNDYTTLISDKAPSSPSTQEEYSYFDSFVPLSIEYDIENNVLHGCFWNFAAGVNKYYPFRIFFDKERIKGGTYDYWSWEVTRIEIIDSDGKDYSYKFQSFKTVSPYDTKALMVQDGKPDATAMIGKIKNFYNGQRLFAQDI